MEQKRVVLLRKAHPVTQAMSSAAKPADLNEGDIRRNPGEPSAAQAAASNYNKPRFEWQGLTIAIENPAGSVRRGPGWEVRMRFDYGEILGTMGVDGDPVDVIVGPNLDAPTVYVVHQRRFNDWANYDEDKCCVGFDSQDDAEQAFLSNYTDPRFLGPITALPVAEFVTKVRATLDAPAMVKAHVNAYARKDGVTVAAHEDSRTKHYQAMFAPSLGIKRQDMPQVPSGVKHKFLDELKAAGVSVEEATVDPKTLKPTQSDYKASNMDHLTAELRAGRYDKDTRILVSSDGRVLDGHHRWAVMAMEGHQLPILKIGMPAMKLLEVARKFNVENGVEARGTEGGPDVLAKASPLVLFLKAHVGPYLRGGKIVNIAGYQGRAARPKASDGQLSLFAPPSVVMGPSPYKGKDPVKDTMDLFEADEHGEMPPAKRATREDDQHDQSKMSNNAPVNNAGASVHADLQALGVTPEIVGLFRKYLAASDALGADPDASAPSQKSAKTKAYRAMYAAVEKLGGNASVIISAMHRIGDFHGPDALMSDAPTDPHAHLLADLPGASWARGKGMISGHYGVKLNGEVVANYHAKPEDAAAEAKRVVADKARWEKEADQRVQDLSALRDRLLAGGQVTDMDLKLVGLRPGSSGLQWFIPAAAKLFGITSHAVRPHIKDLIRVGHTDMGVKKEFVDPAKGLAAIAERLAPKPAPAPHPTETPEFKRWFGSSVITDDWEGGGKPRVLYHGTPADFSEFKPGGHDEGRWRSGPAIWLTPHADRQPAAHNIGGHRGNFSEGTNVMPLYARIENPLYLDEFNVQEMRGRWAADSPGEFPQWMSPATVEKMRAGGFDGIIQFYTDRSGTDNHEVIVFDPKQVKSAIGNSGAFDPDHPDITKSEAPVVVFVKAATPS